MNITGPSEERSKEDARRKAASLHVTSQDPFKARAERDAKRRAEKAAKRGGVAGSVAAFFNPFDRSKAAPAQPGPADDPFDLFEKVGETPIETQVEAQVETRTPEPKWTPADPEAAAAVWAEIDTSLQADAEGEPLQPVFPQREAAEPIVADWEAGPASSGHDVVPAKPAAASLTPLYWSGGKGGSGGGKPKEEKEKALDQDDLAGALMALLILLLGGWVWLNGLGRKTDNDDSAVQPQMATTEPAPTPAEAVAPADPFGPGPVDLTPSSPVPETAPVDMAALSPEPVAPAPSVIGEVASSAPETDATSPTVMAAACTERVVQTYFCTAQSDLTPEARAVLDGQIADWRACIGDQELIVTGYADRRGPEQFNIWLGEQRASKLAALLRQQGFNVAAVSGVGELTDIEDNVNCANQRRVDITLKSSLAAPSRGCGRPQDAPLLSCGG